ncbi:MAG TPA: tRNA-dihydrouridine synthase family protein [Humisphaera sp.]
MPRIGPIELAQPFCQAGLAGYSDRAMRLVARRRGCPYAVTEALLDVILCNGGEGLRKSIDIDAEDHPVAGQVIGSEAPTMAKAAALLHGAGYDVVDLNYACPVKKIKNKARGGHMLKDVPRALDILKAVRDALPPSAVTTISLRKAFDAGDGAEDRLFEIMDAAFAHGYSAVRVHARTVEQKYVGPADWSFLRRVKQRYPDRTILGSGDVFTAVDVVRMLTETGVDVAWVARGAIGNPWIFTHAAQLLAQRKSRGVAELQGGLVASTEVTRDQPTPPPSHPATPSISPPTIHEQRDALAEHFGIAMQIHGEQLAGRRMRKMGIKYSRFHPDGAEVKKRFIAVHSLTDWRNVLDAHYATDGPGMWPAATAADEVNNDPAMQSCEAAA